MLKMHGHTIQLAFKFTLHLQESLEFFYDYVSWFNWIFKGRLTVEFDNSKQSVNGLITR